MAEPIKRGDKYRHEIQVKGERISGTFPTKAAARAWEAEMRAKSLANPKAALVEKKHRLREACDRYLDEISEHKRGAKAHDWEARRFNKLCEEFDGRYIDSIDSDDISAWKARLVKEISGSTIVRYFNLYSHLFTVARREWKWIAVNPFSDVARPGENPPREAKWGWRQIRRVLRAGQGKGGKTAEVTQAFHISLRTGLRLQEALLSPGNVSNDGRVLLIKKRKEAAHPIRIPLTRFGSRVIRRTNPFKVKSNEASTLFSTLVKEAGLGNAGLQYRDSRATALTHLCKRMPVEDLQRISRHKDVNLLINVYYRDTADDIAKRIY